MKKAPFKSILVVVALSLPVFAGCIAQTDPSANALADAVMESADQAVYDPTGGVYDRSKSWSQTLVKGIYERLPAKIQLLPSFDKTDISVGVFRPDIPGCPTDEMAEYPDECKTPVIIDSGPYYSPTSVGVESTRPPIAIWFVPHGYTVVQMAVRGTGGSGGCMEFMSLNEQKDVDAIVTHFGQQPWSNGRVALMGRSYDGTTPFMAAALGNPYLKTIVPISGVADVPELMFRNGTSEFRGPIMHNVVYWLTYGAQAEPDDTKTSQFCNEVVLGTETGAYTALTGDHSVAGQSDYWEVRKFRERTLDNYKGSLYIIHGMQDWNVNPGLVIPWFNDLQDKGLKVKGWFGQWGHAYPDRPDEHINVRWDWAQTLLDWFDSELKGKTIDTGPIVEVEDHRGIWHAEDSYPPRDRVDWTFQLSTEGKLVKEGASTGIELLYDPGGLLGNTITLQSERTKAYARVAGLPQLHVSVTPTTPTTANLYAQLYDVYPDGRLAWMGHAAMNLRYYAGGNEENDLMPGMPVIARMEFEPMDISLPEGHSVRLVIQHETPDAVTKYGGLGGNQADVLPHPESGPVVINFGAESVLRLPVVYR